MQTSLQALLAAGVVALAGCATTGSTTQQSPLLFISTNSFGVDIGASPSSATLPSINLGLKTLDVAIVPVTAEGTNVAIRGCYNAGQNVDSVPACPDATVAAALSPSASSGGPAQAAIAGTSGGNIRLAQAAPLAPGVFALPVKPSGTLKAPPAAPSAVPASAHGNFAQSIRDSLSVFSSFNADTKVGQEAGIQLGKAFATGVAAQQLTEGLNYYLQLKGHALNGSDANKEIALRSECVQAVIDAKDKSAPEASLPNCGEKGLSMEGLRVRIACAQVLKTAMEKKLPAAQLPKCSG